MRLSAVWRALCVVLVFASCARAAVVAGGTGDGPVWFASETIGGTRLNMIMPGSGGGAFVVGPDVSRLPSHLSAGGDRTIVVFDVPGGVRPVRRISARFGPGDRLLGVDLVPLAPLPEDGTLAGVAASPRGVFALLTGLQFPLPTDDAPSFAQGPAFVELTRDGWVRRALPAAIDEGNVWRLMAIDATPAIVEHTGRDTARVWLLGEEGAWSAQVWAIPGDAHAVVPSSGGVLVEMLNGGTASLLFVRGETAQARGSVEGAPPGHAMAPFGDGAVLIGVDRTGADPRLWGASLGGDGRVMHSGALKSVAPINRRDVETLLMLIASAALTTVLFLLRIGHDASGVIVLPAGMSIASTWKRAGAMLIDLAPGLAGVAWLWPMPEGGGSMSDLSMAYGPWPLMTVGAVMFLHSTLSEWLFGRTIGKAIAGCRTISTRTGGRPTLRQAAWRNFIKVACPPLGMVQAMTPGRPEPWGSDTTVVVPTPPEAGDGPGG